MMWTVLVAGVAHARLFTAPAPNVASQPTMISANNAASPLVQPQVFVEMPVPQQAASGFSPVSALGVALFAAGVGVVGGRQAMLLGSGKKSPVPKPTKFTGKSPIKVENRPRNQSGPYQTTKNISVQKNGFGAWLSKFQKAEGKSKYGVPIFLPNGAVNPAYLAAERKEQQAQSKFNTKQLEAKRKGLIKSKKFELADFVRKAVGPVGSGKEYYQSGR